MKPTVILACTTALCAAFPLAASTITGTVKETTIDIKADDNPNAYYSRFGSNHGLRLGVNSYPLYRIEDTFQAQYGYDPFNVDPGEAFELASFNHWNGTNTDGTTPSVIQMSLFFDFLSPEKESKELTFDLNFQNGSGKTSDTFSLPEKSFANETFTINDQTYTVELLGLKEANKPITKTIVTGTTSSNTNFSLLGRFIVIPEPGTIVLAATGLIAIVVSRRDRKPKKS
ncbi:hypothetical protein KS4_35710 [Poriferisphaera corsica]|uniref:Ice-binding protein C-terminal domain-containing protein n=1 Tax=Poriferisphaera corsica TaxID=2528020 RepID=A0A517YZ39_9BACT|nr:choice-of-anchor K domain-containing protein [Poriferisphaera corsica]QDU35488.1 hypothetical protein KS4_35710 [Poriferisphaera corsica]